MPVSTRPTLTGNLFRSTGPKDHRLRVVDGTWPTDVAGAVYIVGPDKRSPGGHWFAERGQVMRVQCRPDRQGAIGVTTRLVRTPVLRVRDRLPWLFRTVAFASVSPLGATNLANTNVEAMSGRLFLGYDAGRQVEIDPDTLEYLTPVGSNGEWMQAMPGPVEPMVAVAAHPAADVDEGVMYFANYSPIPGPEGAPSAHVARWDLAGRVDRWPLHGLPHFDTIHDIKSTSGHLVFCDLPFAVGPETFRGLPRTSPNSDITRICVVAKADLRSTPPGSPVPVSTFEVPMPTGHLSVDAREVDGRLTVYLEHIPLSDLMIMLRAGETTHNGTVVPADYEGLIALAVQPGVVGRYVLDLATGEVVDSQVAWDDRFWGPVLATRDRSSVAARQVSRQLWFAGLGYDPDLIPAEWWRLYADAGLNCVVPPAELPTAPIPGALARFDLDSMKVVELFTFDDGAFASPPQFVPRVDATEPDDGYVFVMVHRDGDKELWMFDSAAIERGPIARATVDGFCPPLLLHSTWLGDERPPRPAYRIPLRRDVWEACKEMPRHLLSLFRTGRAMAESSRSPR